MPERTPQEGGGHDGRRYEPEPGGVNSGVGDLGNQAALLPTIADLDLRAGRTGDAAAHLREGLHLAVRIGNWFELRTGLSQCGNLCAATGRAAEALTLRAACASVDQHQGPIYPPWFLALWENSCARPGRRWDRPGRGRPSSAARR